VVFTQLKQSCHYKNSVDVFTASVKVILIQICTNA